MAKVELAALEFVALPDQKTTGVVAVIELPEGTVRAFKADATMRTNWDDLAAEAAALWKLGPKKLHERGWTDTPPPQFSRFDEGTKVAVYDGVRMETFNEVPDWCQPVTAKVVVAAELPKAKPAKEPKAKKPVKKTPAKPAPKPAKQAAAPKERKAKAAPELQDGQAIELGVIPTTSGKVRYLCDLGWTTADIARFLAIAYTFASNVVAAHKKGVKWIKRGAPSAERKRKVKSTRWRHEVNDYLGKHAKTAAEQRTAMKFLRWLEGHDVPVDDGKKAKAS